jgi:hypothetical protein
MIEEKKDDKHSESGNDTKPIVSRRSTFDGPVYTYICPVCKKEYDHHFNSRIRQPMQCCNACFIESLYGG